MTPQPPELVLYGVFRALLARRVPLGVVDYLDAVRALRAGFGSSPGREPLRRLARMLWARTDDERRLIDALFAAIPPPTTEEIAKAESVLSQGGQQPVAETAQPMPPGTASDRTGAGGTSMAATEPQAAIEFRPAAETGGLPLPRLALGAESAPETYVMQPQTVVTARTLAALWRRLRAFTRTGAKTEFDPEATLTERCRQGVLVRPVFRACRRNQARLLILADVSTSMAPWRPFLDTLARSLPLSRLQAVEIHYFANLPRRSLFATAELTEPEPFEKTCRRFSGASLLIIGDGGAARGYLSRRRVHETDDFLAQARQAMAPSAIVWLNPMPRERWAGTTAEMIARGNDAAFVALHRTTLFRVVDILRGARTA